MRSKPVAAAQRPEPLSNWITKAPPSGDAEFRLAWSSKRLPPEPVPATAFVHDADEPARCASACWLATGAQLFAEHQCAKCHQPHIALAGRPRCRSSRRTRRRLMASAAACKAPWIAQWLLDPKAIRPDALMPRMLSGPQAATDAADIAAYLAGLRDGWRPACTKRRATVASAHEPRRGRRQALRRPRLRRLPLAARRTDADQRHARAAEPCRGEMATGGARRVPARTRNPLPLDPHAGLQAGDERGGGARGLRARTRQDRCPLAGTRRRGCQRPPGRRQPRRRTGGLAGLPELPHARQGAGPIQSPALASLAAGNWTRGCVADDAAARGKAPDFSFDDAQRAALRAFAKDGFAEALHRDVAAEFAERQYVSPCAATPAIRATPKPIC